MFPNASLALRIAPGWGAWVAQSVERPTVAWVMISQFVSCFFLFFFLIFFSTFFIYFWHRERQSMNGGGAEREGDTESEIGSRLQAISPEPDAGLELTDREIVIWLKSDA